MFDDVLCAVDKDTTSLVAKPIKDDLGTAISKLALPKLPEHGGLPPSSGSAVINMLQEFNLGECLRGFDPSVLLSRWARTM